MTARVEPPGGRQPGEPEAPPGGDLRWDEGRPPLERSPVHLFALVNGILVVLVGWVAATLFERSLTGLSHDLTDAVAVLPAWAEQGPRMAAALGSLGVVVAVPVWLLQDRRFRQLALVAAAAAAAVVLSWAVAEAVEAVLRPATRAAYDVLPVEAARSGPTDPSVAATVAVLTMIRRDLTPAVRRTVYRLLPVWLLANVAIEAAPPYLGVILDVGVGLVASSAVALLLRTTSLRPTAGAIARGLAANGLVVSAVEPAPVDARASTPWMGTTIEGRPLFIKTLSHEQRVADIMFRAVRWLRLRRTGDAPPESSLRRSAEHEAFVSHHARALGVATPQALTVADIGEGNVALVFAAVGGRSLDQVEAIEITDEVLVQAWRLVAILRANGIAHRDLRLANLLLADDGTVLLVDFGFAELSASADSVDTDVAELLTATSVAVGVPRAVRAAMSVLGPGPLSDAGEWLDPLALSSETRRAAVEARVLGPLQGEVVRRTGSTVEESEPLGRLHLQRLVGPISIAVALYALVPQIIEVADPMGSVVWQPAVGAVGLSILAYPAAGLSLVSASGRRVTMRGATRAMVAARLPVHSPTTWSHAARVVSVAIGGARLSRPARQRAIARWIGAGIAVAPVLVAVATLAAGRRPLGYVVASAIGAASGALVALVQYAMLHCTPWGRDLSRVWLDPGVTVRTDRGQAAATLFWAGVASLIEATAVLLAVRSVGYGASAAGVIAIAIAVPAVASLVPARGGIGVTDGLLLLGLAAGGDVATAALAVVVARLATFWLHLPAAWVAQRAAGPSTAAAT